MPRYIKNKEVLARYRYGKPVVQRYRYGKPVWFVQEEYTKLLAIKGDGNQYFLTDYQGGPYLNTEIHFSVEKSAQDAARLMGAYQTSDTGNGTIRYEAAYVTSLARMRIGDGYGDGLVYDISQEDIATGIHILNLNANGETFFDGTKVGDYTKPTSISNYNVGIMTRIGATGAPDSGANKARMTVYKVILRDNTTGQVLQYLEPVIINATGEVCMRDSITGNYIKNAGTGVFTAIPL